MRPPFRLLSYAVLVTVAATGLAGCASNRKKLDQVEKAEADKALKGRSGFLKKLGSGKSNPAPCPNVGILHDAERVVEFKDNTVRYANVRFSGEIDKVRGFCRYWDDRPIEMELDIDFALGRGPAADGKTHDYRYFVAVTRTNLVTLQREVFPLTIKFDDKTDRVHKKETIERISIPRVNADVAGENFEVLVGFELSPEELAFNRSEQRFRPDISDRNGARGAAKAQAPAAR